MFRRTLYLRRREEVSPEACPDVFTAAAIALQQAVPEQFVKATMELPDLSRWPAVQWQGESGCVQAEQWSAEHEPHRRLLTLTLAVRQPRRVWRLALRLGAMTRQEAVLQEEWRPDPAPARFPIAELPHLVRPMPGLLKLDVDGMRAGALYRLRHDRVGPLREFVTQPPQRRRLPVVVISPHRLSQGPGDSPFIINLRETAMLLNGVAHVVYLDATETWGRFDVLDPHGCYNGAFRVYWPGYSPDDDHDTHDFWLPGPPDVVHERKMRMLDKVLRSNFSDPDCESTMQQLLALRLGEQTERQVGELVARKHVEWEQAGAAQQEAMWQQLLADYQGVCGERDFLRAEVGKLDDELRQVRFRINQQYFEPEKPAAGATEALPFLTLADAALAAFANLDNSEQRYMEDNLFSKLTVPELRDASSELFHFCDGGSGYIFPRSNSGSGRRLVYLLDGLEVRICEVYANHDAYEAARGQGWRRASYPSGERWTAAGAA